MRSCDGMGTAIPPRFTERAWLWRVAISFVVATLIALVLVPWFVQQRVNQLRRDVSVAEPARTLVNRWQFNLARQLAAIDEQILTGDTAEYATYTEALRREQRIRRQLAEYVEQLGPAAMQQFRQAATLSDHWHARVREEELFRFGPTSAELKDVSRETDLFEQTLQQVAVLDSVIAATFAESTQEIRRAERIGLQVTLVLGGLALIAAGAVIALRHRIRLFAAEAERRRSQAAAALTQMSEAEDARTRLLRGITHDVKNPLGAAKGYIELLNLGVKAPVHPEQKPLLEGVERSIDGALAIIDDLLDVARRGEDGISMHRETIDLNDIAAEAVADFTPAARSAGHTIERAPAPGPLNVATDPGRVRQILENLLSNAIKYTPPPGHITVRVQRTFNGDAPGPGPWATILVSDTGPGIPREKRELVFEEYTRLQKGDAKGHGLGMAIARGISRRLGGDLTIADAEPGATFVLWLPIEDANEQ